MNRTSKVERTYSLGQFKNIKLFDEITDIPEELALNDEYMSTLKFLQILSVEQTYREYLQLYEKDLLNVAVEDSLAILDDKQVSTLEKLNL